GQRRAPDDVLLLGPVQRQARLAADALAVRPAELRPVRAKAGGGEGEEEKPYDFVLMFHAGAPRKTVSRRPRGGGGVILWAWWAVVRDQVGRESTCPRAERAGQ